MLYLFLIRKYVDQSQWGLEHFDRVNTYGENDDRQNYVYVSEKTIDESREHVQKFMSTYSKPNDEFNVF